MESEQEAGHTPPRQINKRKVQILFAGCICIQIFLMVGVQNVLSYFISMVGYVSLTTYEAGKLGNYNICAMLLGMDIINTVIKIICYTVLGSGFGMYAVASIRAIIDILMLLLISILKSI